MKPAGCSRSGLHGRTLVQFVPMVTTRTQIRVRYAECDPMGVAHHTAYPVWFEIGRTELCRASGVSYRDLESRGIAMAVIALTVKYRASARYDDVLELETTLTRSTRVKLEHEYRLTRDRIVLATGATTLACLDSSGRPREVPAMLRTDGPDVSPA